VRKTAIEVWNMEKIDILNDDVNSGLEDVHSVMRRQFVASVVAALLIAAIAGMIAMRPVHHETAQIGAQRYAGIQQPTFVTAPSQRLASLTKRTIELP
jgi:hypothetical protein